TSLVFKRPMAANQALVATTATREATLAAIEALKQNPEVEYAEPDYVRTRSGEPMTPSDPLFGKQWALPMIQAPQAWGDGYRGADSVTVAVSDTGWVQHPEIADRVVNQYDFISDASNAADGDGRDGDATDAGSSDDASSALHGTHVAGIVAAKSDNAVGVAGL